MGRRKEKRSRRRKKGRWRKRRGDGEVEGESEGSHGRDDSELRAEGRAAAGLLGAGVLQGHLSDSPVTSAASQVTVDE